MVWKDGILLATCFCYMLCLDKSIDPEIMLSTIRQYLDYNAQSVPSLLFLKQFVVSTFYMDYYGFGNRLPKILGDYQILVKMKRVV